MKSNSASMPSLSIVNKLINYKCCDLWVDMCQNLTPNAYHYKRIELQDIYLYLSKKYNKTYLQYIRNKHLKLNLLLKLKA